MNYLPVILSIAAIICAAVLAAAVLAYRRGRLAGRVEAQAERLKKRDSLQKDLLSKNRQIQTLEVKIRELGKTEDPSLRRLEALEDKLRQKVREISLLSEASLFLTTGDFQKTCDLIAFRAGILPHVKFARLYMLSEEGTRLRLVSGHNISEKYLEMIKDSFELSVNNIPAGVAVMSKVPFVVDDVSRDDHFARWREITTLYDYRSYIAAPLLRANKVLGVLEIFFEKENVPTKDALDVVNIIANMGALSLENCSFIDRLEELSRVDELTQAFNHRFLMNTFEKELERAVRYGHSLSYIMIDLDNFKTINDTLGHLKGDEVLSSVARIMKKTVRGTDYVCRYGGDEFGILLPETNEEETVRVLEKIRAELRSFWEGLPPGTGMSTGFSVYPEDGGTATELIRRADGCVYEKKREKKAR